MKIENFWNLLENKISFPFYEKYPKTGCRSVKHFDKHLHSSLCPIFERKKYVSGARKETFEKYAFKKTQNVFNFLSTELNNTPTCLNIIRSYFFKPLTITPENLIEIKHHLIKIRSTKVKRCIHELYGKLSSDPLILFLSASIQH